MTNTSETPVNNVVPLAIDLRRAAGSLQWFLEAGEDATYPVFHRNQMNYFVCGEEAFVDIAASIKAAKKSIDIVCWGFDPAMELTREKCRDWPRGDTWGGLLLDAVKGSTSRAPVQVRILSWFDAIGEKLQNNMPGFVHAAANPVPPAWQEAVHDTLRGEFKADSPFAGLTLQGKRMRANQFWYNLTKSGQLPGLQLRLRNGNGAAISRAMADVEAVMPPGFLEDLLIKGWGTYHQKTVLIDYDDTSAQAKPVGYVMGLNSVTDYWDTRHHRFEEPKRGCGWEGVDQDSSVSNLKPLQDYATRIEGEALVMVSKNFTDAWNKAHPVSPKASAPLQRTHDPKNPPPNLTHNLGVTAHSVQLVRTEPVAQEKGIERLYYQTLKSARNYIYIENQYFQFAPWVKALKAEREKHNAALNARKVPKDQRPLLHLLVVTPTPEKTGMVPRTHDTIKELGHGNSLPNQSKKFDDEIKRYKADLVRYEKAMSEYRIANHAVPGATPPPSKPEISPIAKTYMESGGGTDDEAIQQTLRLKYGLRSLVASMWTFDVDYHNRQAKTLREIDALKARAIKVSKPMENPLANPMLQNDGSMYTKEAKRLQDQANAERYREIYIHSKLMIADDSVFTIGSANLNARSLYGDGEINMVSDCPRTSARLRREIWGLQTGGLFSGDSARGKDMKRTFEDWETLLKGNLLAMDAGERHNGFIVPMKDERTSSFRVG